MQSGHSEVCEIVTDLFLLAKKFIEKLFITCTYQARVVQRLDNTIRQINHYPADSVVGFVDTYPLDSDLSSR